ncbi:MAG: endo alpha-1,4 polygalactosaminidase [Bacteroidetes bacterium]|nr:endo alpha-1,4 polygalactosaminidase [Bacteroidota bacterium]
MDYRNEMRKFVEKISSIAKTSSPSFAVIPQNGLDLMSSDGTKDGLPETNYLNAIDGTGQEELWYGYDNNDDQPTPPADHEQLLSMCKFARDHNKKVLITDYCYSSDKISDSYVKNYSENFISFAANHRDLDDVPSASITNENSNNIDSISQAGNFLYIISPSLFSNKDDFVNAVSSTNYDLVIMDLFFDENTALTAADIARMHVKANGGRRKLICYMSIGEAETYRWYWKNSWYAEQPSFIVDADPDWTDNYYVKYWDPQWQNIICGYSNSYLEKIMNAGFDGVYLDLVSAYEFFES